MSSVDHGPIPFVKPPNSFLVATPSLSLLLAFFRMCLANLHTSLIFRVDFLASPSLSSPYHQPLRCQHAALLFESLFLLIGVSMAFFQVPVVFPCLGALFLSKARLVETGARQVRKQLLPIFLPPHRTTFFRYGHAISQVLKNVLFKVSSPPNFWASSKSLCPPPDKN